MNTNMELLRTHSVFWSKLGFCYDPPRLDKDGKPIVFFENFERFNKIAKGNAVKLFGLE